MLSKSGANRDFKQARLPLRLVLVVPFVLQTFAAVGLTAYLSFRNGQKAINDLVTQLQTEVSSCVDQHLDTYLATPHVINQINADAIKLGLLNLRDFKNIEHYFWKQMQVFDVGYISLVLPTNEFAGAGYYRDLNHVTIDETSPNTKGKSYTYATDSQGNRTSVTHIEDYDALAEDSYQAPVRAGKPVWSKVYQWNDSPEIISISASYPIYNQTKTLTGVLAIDLRLSQINDFLRQLKISPQGKIFIVEPNGLLVASSSTEPPFKLINGKAQRLLAADSSNPLIRATARQLMERLGNLSQITASVPLNFTLKGQRQFAQVTPWRDQYDLDWLIVVAVPESDFMAQINANTRTTILLCLGALGLATVLGIYTSRWITQPIWRLSAASTAIASGDLDQTVEAKVVKELGILAESFNRMAGQLRSSFAALEKSNSALEQRVEERTKELKLALSNADAASKAKSEFLANMSHELRTPLNGVLGYTQILQRDKTASSKQQEGLNIIHQSASHLLTLINDVLDISKIEAQKLELYSQDFHFENFLTVVIEICRIKAEQKEIDFSYQHLNQLPTAIHTDEKRLGQVLINLIGNAIKFTDTGSVTFIVGVVTGDSYLDAEDNSQLTTDARSGKPTMQKIRFCVEDTGIGMTQKQLEKIFLPFEQVGEHSRKAEGTGLGLAISQQIAALMGSEIFVESIYGEGSKFWFDLDLPEAKDWVDCASSKFAANVISYTGKQRTILIVDDRCSNRSVLVNMLEPIGFKLIEASHGQQGLELARKFQPDLIITDLMMPEMNGFEMAQNLRKLAEFQATVIIASSASVFSFERQKSSEAGCNDFLAKPVQVSELLHQLQRYLQLTWIYEEPESIKDNQSVTSVDEMVIPPKEQLIALHKAAKSGCISEIQELANKLLLTTKYTAFANRVLKLAREFDDEAIVNLVQTYLS